MDLNSLQLAENAKPKPFGHYFILEKIAQGGMAEIFKGLTYDFLGIKKFIVIKRILPHIAANKAFIDMLIAEAKIAVNLSHGNIAQTYDLGKVGDDYFIVMEYIDGKTLSQIQKQCQLKSNLIPIEFVVHWISELCAGLEYMHRKKDEFGNELKIVHCDVSPQNMIVNDSGNLKIVDFGVAQAALKLPIQDGGALKGKFAYLSPEQADNHPVDHRSDLFSAGIVLWEFLTGHRLFKKASNSQTVEAVRSMQPLPPSEFNPDIPEVLDRIVLKALEKKPEARYQSAAEMGIDLTKYLHKHHPHFKTLNITQFFGKLFDLPSDNTEIYLEKTVREEITPVEEPTPTDGKSASNTDDTTQWVNPVEIDFHSIFNEITLNDPPVFPGFSHEKNGRAPFDYTSENVDLEPTGEVILPRSTSPVLLEEDPDLDLELEKSITIEYHQGSGQLPLKRDWVTPVLFVIVFALTLVGLLYWLNWLT